jgi:hypothetical protein
MIMLEISFAVNAWEYFEGLLISSLKRFFPRVGFLIFPLIFLIGLVGVLQITRTPGSISIFAAVLLGVLVLAIAGVPALRSLQYSRNPSLSAPATWRIGEKRIEIVTGRGEAKVDWKTFSRPMETWHLFLLHSAADNQKVYILPKRAFRDDPQRARFRRMAAGALGKMR